MDMLQPACRSRSLQRECNRGDARQLLALASRNARHCASRPASSPSSALVLVAALLLRLVGLAGMGLAIGRAGFGTAAAEMELGGGGIADRPAAHAVARWSARWRNCRPPAAADLPPPPGRRAWRCAGCWPWAPWQAGAVGAGRAGAAGQAQAMDLADHGIAGDAAQGAGDLAGRKPFGPEVLQLLDPVVGPVCLCHARSLGSIFRLDPATRSRLAWGLQPQDIVPPATAAHKPCRGAATPCPQDLRDVCCWQTRDQGAIVSALASYPSARLKSGHFHQQGARKKRVLRGMLMKGAITGVLAVLLATTVMASAQGASGVVMTMPPMPQTCSGAWAGPPASRNARAGQRRPPQRR